MLTPLSNFLRCLVVSFALTLLVPRQFVHAQSGATNLKHRNPKINGRILAAAEKLISQKSPSLSKSTRPSNLVKTDGTGDVQTYIFLDTVSDNKLQLLREQGARIEIARDQDDVVQAWLPAARLEQIAAFDFVTSIRPPDYAIVLTGSVNSEGDALLRANEVRIVNGVDGNGIRVGVISNGIDHASVAQGSGDLPAAIDVDQNLQGSGDEGTAMLEIVYDLAPGAQLAFSGPATGLEMLNAITYLANSAFNGQGCNVIVDDLGFLGEPNFEDGAIAQRVEQVVAQGVTYVTATGNEARKHYEKATFNTSSTIAGQTMTVHDFGRAAGGLSDPGQSITVGANKSLTVVLQWSDAYFNPNDDYDLLITDAARTQVLASSTDPQNGGSGQFAIEVATYDNAASTSTTVEVVIVNDGAPTRTLEMFYIGENFTINQYNVPEGSIVPGQQSTPNSIAVGAISVLDPGFDTIESFSSRGPVRIFSPTIQQRVKPDIVASDGVRITGAGGFGVPFGSDIRFFGSSAAAPHVAAVAALLLSQKPNLTPAQVKDAIQASALDLGASGADNTYGSGRTDAFRAFQRVVTSISTPEKSSLPTTFSLAQNYPNPFNPSTTINYSVSEAQRNAIVTLEIFNMLGQKVRTLVNATHTSGNYQVTWNGRNDNERDVTSGLYIYRLKAGNRTLSKRMLLLK